jgi:hypothetical protein
VYLSISRRKRTCHSMISTLCAGIVDDVDDETMQILMGVEPRGTKGTIQAWYACELEECRLSWSPRYMHPYRDGAQDDELISIS